MNAKNTRKKPNAVKCHKSPRYWDFKVDAAEWEGSDEQKY